MLVHAVSPGRDACEITFPRVVGYRIELQDERLSATFDANWKLTLDSGSSYPGMAKSQGLIGEATELDLERLECMPRSEIACHLARHLLAERLGDLGTDLHLFGQLKQITKEWLDEHLDCKGDTYPAHVLYKDFAGLACDRIIRAITGSHVGKQPVRAIIDPGIPTGTTKQVHFHCSPRPFTNGLTPGKCLWKTYRNRCHVNLVVCDSSWEADFCHLAENAPRVRAYVKNEGLGIGVPYRFGTELRIYSPDFILLLDDGKGEDNLLHIVVEIKGFGREDAKGKASTMENLWIPGVNSLGTFGRWAFIELGGACGMQDGLEARLSIRRQFVWAMRDFLKEPAAAAAEILIRLGGTQPDAEYIPRRRSKPVECFLGHTSV